MGKVKKRGNLENIVAKYKSTITHLILLNRRVRDTKQVPNFYF